MRWGSQSTLGGLGSDGCPASVRFSSKRSRNANPFQNSTYPENMPRFSNFNLQYYPWRAVPNSWLSASDENAYIQGKRKYGTRKRSSRGSTGSSKTGKRTFGKKCWGPFFRQFLEYALLHRSPNLKIMESGFGGGSTSDPQPSNVSEPMDWTYLGWRTAPRSIKAHYLINDPVQIVLVLTSFFNNSFLNENSCYSFSYSNFRITANIRRGYFAVPENDHATWQRRN